MNYESELFSNNHNFSKGLTTIAMKMFQKFLFLVLFQVASIYLNLPFVVSVSKEASPTAPEVSMTPKPRTLHKHFLSDKAAQILQSMTSEVGRKKLELAATPTFIITPQYSATLLANPNVVAIKAAITAAINAYQSSLSTTGTATFTFDLMTTGLGMSSTYLTSVSYSDYRLKLAALSQSATDMSALASLPVQPNEPVTSKPNLWISYAHARTLGYTLSTVSQDSTISVNIGICNLDRVTINPSFYDLLTVLLHEIDSSLGVGSGLGSTIGGIVDQIYPTDLFRYSSSGVRSYSFAAPAAYFSVDGGVTNLVNFINSNNNGGDTGDFASGPVYAQNAFGTPGSAGIADLTVEKTLLDAIGYNFISTGTTTKSPSFKPTIKPTFQPTTIPSFKPSVKSSFKPSTIPSFKPTTKPSFRPSTGPTVKPTIRPSTKSPSSKPSTRSPSVKPSSRQPTFAPL